MQDLRELTAGSWEKFYPDEVWLQLTVNSLHTETRCHGAEVEYLNLCDRSS